MNICVHGIEAKYKFLDIKQRTKNEISFVCNHKTFSFSHRFAIACSRRKLLIFIVALPLLM